MLSIRTSYAPDEVPALYAIECECFGKEFRWTEKAFRSTLAAAKAKRNIWIADMGGKPAGFLLAGDEAGRAHIETVNVTELHRRKGIATKLIAACEKGFHRRGYGEIKLEVHTDNPAYIIYFNLGYRVTGFKHNYYRLGAHAITMTKAL